MRLGLSLGLGRRGRGAAQDFNPALTGLTSGEARNGATIGVSIPELVGGETVTYQWTDNGSNISGATSSTFTVNIGTNMTDGNILRVVATVDGTPYTSNAAPARYAPGAASAIADGQAWTVDDTSVNLNAAASGTGLTWTYGATGLPAGVSINTGTGAITGTPTGASSGTVTVTATDQYGRTVQDTFTYTSTLRTQATGGADLDLSFVEDSAISSTDLKANWTTNGNTLTYAITGTALPTGLSVSSSGVMTGTPTTVTADATYTLRGTDEYGRTTDDTFTLQITELDDTAPAVASFSVGTQASDGDIPISVGAITEAGSPDDLTFGYVVTGTDQSAATPVQVKTAAEGGTALTDQLDIGTFAITTAGGTFNEALTAGIDDATSYVQAVVWDAAGNISTVQADGPVDIDTTAPTLSSPTGTQTGQTTADWGVTSNEASGTIYAGVRPTASAALTAAQLVAGSGGAGVAWNSDATPTADANNGGSFTGLTAATAYKVDIVQVDAVGNTSAVSSSAEFTTASAASPPAVTYLASGSDITADSQTRTVSGLDASGQVGTADIFVCISNYAASRLVPASVTVDGNSASLVSGASGNRFEVVCSIWRLTGVDIGATVSVVADYGTGNTGGATGIFLYSAENVTSVDGAAASDNAVTLSIAHNVANDDAIIALFSSKSTGGGGAVTWSGVTQDERFNLNNRPSGVGHVENLTANAAYTVSAATALANNSVLTTVVLS